MDDLPQKLDMYFPNQGGSWPVVVYLHGGAWTKGDKADVAGLPEWLNPLGYVVVSANYRMYPQAHFPAFIEDAKCAIRFLRAHADQYKINPQRIAAWGVSAGGHLAALLGTADESAGWDVGEYLEQSSRVQGVVDVSGPADLTVPGTKHLEPLIKLAFDPDPAQRAGASPVTYATSDDPPFLIFHGDNDEIVDVSQGQAMYDALIRAGAAARLVIVQNGTHSLTTSHGEPVIPTSKEISKIMLDFLEETLKNQ